LKPPFPTFSKNGTVLPISEATVSLLNIEYSYGYGVYETLKLRNKILYFVDQHLERLEHSLRTIEISSQYTTTEIKKFLFEFVESLAVDSCNIKILVIGGPDTAIYIFASAPLFPDRKLYQKGARLMTYEYERLFPTAKTLNMLPSYIAYKKAQEHGCYDALLIDHNQIILEGTRTNFCLIKDKTIFHAPRQRILGGVTLLTLSQVAQVNGFELVEKEVPLQNLQDYDGAFITSTSTKIMPVAQVNDFVYPQIPESVHKLVSLYDEFLDRSQGVYLI